MYVLRWAQDRKKRMKERLQANSIFLCLALVQRDPKNLGTSLQENHDFITQRACLVTSVNARLLKDQLERETEQWCIAKTKLQGILFLTRPSFHNHHLYRHHHHHYIHCYSQYHQQINVHHQESHLLSLSAREKVWEKVARDFSSKSEVMTSSGIHSDGGENLDFLTGFSIYSDWWKNRCWMFQPITKSLPVSVWVLKTEWDFSANQKGKHSNPKSRTALETRCQLLNLHWKITLPCSVDEIILFCFTPPARQQHSFLETKYLTITVMQLLLILNCNVLYPQNSHLFCFAVF